MKFQISRSIISLAVVVAAGPALQAQGDPPVPRGTWTETRDDAPGVIFIHRRGQVMEVTRVPGTGEGGIPLELEGPSEVSMKWVGAPVAWPPGVGVEEETELCDGIVRIRVAGDAQVAAAELAAMPEVLFAYPVEFTAPLFSRVMPTDQLVLRLEAGNGIGDVTAAFPVVEVAPMLDSTVEYVVRLLDPKAAAPDIVAADIEASGLVEWVQRDCLRDAEFFWTPPPNDTNYTAQWHLDATGQTIGSYTAPANIDVNAPAAWTTNQGSPTIQVAVIDDAFETAHPDLAANFNLAAAIDYYNYPVTDTNVNPDGPYDMHGTPCAGIVGAVANNATGVAGMAPSSPIVPIKINSNGNMPYDSTVGNSIRHAAQNADIVTCSWGYVNPAPVSLSSTKYALQWGAGGRGSVVFFAAGNAGGFTLHYHVFTTPGTYDIRWSYTKDGSVSSGLDRCFVDSVYYPDGTTQLFDGLIPPALPAGWVSSGGTWTSLAASVGNRAESGTQFIGSPTITHNQSTSVAQYSITVPPGGGTLYYDMRVDAQPSTWVLNTETQYDFGQFEYKQSGSPTWIPAYAQGGQPNVISYPAADPETIAVGANDTSGRRSHYSQWGAALDFVAPSDGGWVGLGIETTDLTNAQPAGPWGFAGYDSGNYCKAHLSSKFGGTSAACPLAAGVGALVRSVNPGLSPSQVRNLMRSTSIQRDPAWYTYSGGRCDQVGHGQVDANAAVAAAGASPPVAQIAFDLKITEVSPVDSVCPFVEIYNSSMANGYALHDVMLTDCETGGDPGESAFQFPPGSGIPPQGTIIVALGPATASFVAELNAVQAGGGATAGGLQLFECQGSGLVFNAAPIPVLLPNTPMPTINLAASDNLTLVVTPGMMASYLPDVVDGMSYGTPAVTSGCVIGAAPSIPDAAPAVGGASGTSSYQRSGWADTEVSLTDFNAIARSPGRIAFGLPVQSLDPLGLTSSEIDVWWTPANPGDQVVIVASLDPIFSYPVHGMPYNPGDPFGADFVVWFGPGPNFIDVPYPPSTPVYYRAWTADPTMNYSPGITAMTSTLASPLPLPLVDPFPAPTLSPVIWPHSVGASIDPGSLALAPPSPPDCARLDSASGSPVMACRSVTPGAATEVAVRYFFQEGGAGDPPEPGEDLIVEYLDPGRVWQPLMMHPVSGPMGHFQLMELRVPPGMLHSEFRVRFRTLAVSATTADNDDWFIDDFSIAVDFDNDGMEDGWELLYFPDLATADATTDWDKDGFSDLFEWTAGTDPTDPQSLLVLKITPSSTPGTYDFEWPSVSGRSYHIQTCSDLQSWTDKVTNILATPPKNTWSDTPGGTGPLFYRLRVTR